MTNNPELDLHSIKHADVDLIVENFVFKNQDSLPALVICGNSNSMIDIVRNTLNRIDFKHEDSRYGVIRIF